MALSLRLFKRRALNKWREFTRPKVKRCCRRPENLSIIESRDQLVVSRCAVCSCRHFELTIEKGVIGIKGATL